MSYKGFNLQDLKHKFDELRIDTFEWKDIKRLPQSFKRKAKLGTFTFDERFDELHRDLGVVEGQFKGLMQHCRSWSKELENQVSISMSVGESLVQLFDPYNTLTREDRDRLKTKSINHISENLFKSVSERELFVKQYELWKQASDYTTKASQMQFISDDPKSVCDLVKSKCQSFLCLIDQIKARIKHRNHALDDHDSVANQLDNLVLASQTRDLSTKEIQQKFNLERRLDFCKEKYDSINAVFLQELPMVMSLAQEFLLPISQLLFFTQLSATYQITCNLFASQEEAEVDITYLQQLHWTEKLVAEADESIYPAQMAIEQLKTTSFTKNYAGANGSMSKSADFDYSQTDANVSLYEVVHPFTAQQEGDLSLNVGDIVRVTNPEGGWWEGELNGKMGTFPSNYIKEIHID